MCIQKIEAYTDSKGGVFTTERCAIESEIAIVTGMTPDDVLTLIGKASPLVPLLQRVLSIAPPPPKAKPPSAEAVRTPEADDDIYSGPSIHTPPLSDDDKAYSGGVIR